MIRLLRLTAHGPDGRHSIRTLLASIGRRLLWRIVFTVTGGLRTTGHPPTGPCVIVANHSSHADTAALIAALHARRRPVAAAAADYWFGRTGRAFVGRALCAAFPVRRGGGGSADLAEALRLLDSGRDVIIFPEGTRSRDGRVGRFHSGAIRLAQAAGATLVPVRIEGTGRLLPVHGHPHPARVTVHFGVPMRTAGTDDTTELVSRAKAAVGPPEQIGSTSAIGS